MRLPSGMWAVEITSQRRPELVVLAADIRAGKSREIAVTRTDGNVSMVWVDRVIGGDEWDLDYIICGIKRELDDTVFSR